MSQHIVTLAGETDWVGFRHEARALLSALVAPDEVVWQTACPPTADVFAKVSGRAMPRRSARQGTANLLLPHSFLSLCETVVLHNASWRFGLLYRLLWRAVHEPGLLRDPLDADRVQARHMAQAVRRDMQKMKTLLRFRPVAGATEADVLLLAWFAPDHHIVQAVAPYYARRLPRQRWAILTPDRSVRWDGELLEFGPGATASPEGPAAQWLDALRDVFSAAPVAPRSDTENASARSFRPDSAPTESMKR